LLCHLETCNPAFGKLPAVAKTDYREFSIDRCGATFTRPISEKYFWVKLLDERFLTNIEKSVLIICITS
jgi:hypothetical protein